MHRRGEAAEETEPGIHVALFTGLKDGQNTGHSLNTGHSPPPELQWVTSLQRFQRDHDPRLLQAVFTLPGPKG